MGRDLSISSIEVDGGKAGIVVLRRALSISSIETKKYKIIPFGGELYEAFGTPEKRGIGLIWGGSGNGKTGLMLQLAREYSKHGRVAINSLEMGFSMAMRDAIVNSGLSEANRKIILLQEPIAELSERLLRPKSPDFIFIDSLQYSGLNYQKYKEFKEKHRNKFIYFISHADGKTPAGRAAKSIMFDADFKIWVEGYKAFSKGRYIGPNGGMYTIWHEGAQRYWLDSINN